MSDNPKEAEKEMEKAIFISADCWLEVFDLLPPSQLGLGIAMISHRFDYFVDEHFKTRKWILGQIIIQCKIGQNGAEEMEIVNSNGKALPIPQNPLPNKVIGFGSIETNYFDQNVITFFGHFHRFFASSTTKLFICAENIHISEFVVHNIWPMFKPSIRQIAFNPIAFGQIRQFAPSMLFDCPSLHVVDFVDGGILPEFPPDDSANASDGQAVAKWLFTPRPDNLKKMLGYFVNSATEEQWSAIVEQIKAAFSAASSPVSFAIISPSSLLSSFVPFVLTNEFTGEKLALLEDGEDDKKHFVLIRFPIAVGNLEKWIKDEMDEFDDGQMNKIGIMIKDDGFDKSLFDAASSAVPCGDH